MGMVEDKDRSISTALGKRMQARVAGLGDDGLHAYLAEAVYLERSRLQRSRDATADEDKSAIETAAQAIHAGRPEMSQAVDALTRSYGHEIHNHFSKRTYEVATKLLPSALSRLLMSADPKQSEQLELANRIAVAGPIEQLRELSKTHTLVLAPTHVSNLDSPVIGYALYQSGLPPFIYGAGLNLFSNPAMSFFMSRLGAYTVDRRKRHRIYKDVLKDYSTERIGRGAHSLFFPGGTRARSGRIESKLKLGLLGTALQAWQEGLAEGREQPEILVVPCTLSFSLVLEAETLIEDSLSEQGKARYIITDDEFSEPTTVYRFARKVLDMDASVHVRFGTPMDLLGNPVDEAGRSMNSGAVFDRRAYVTDRTGAVVADSQRDRAYTHHLATALTAAYQRDNTVLSTHLVARAAWDCLTERYPRLDTYQRVMLARFERWVDRKALIARIGSWIEIVDQCTAAGTLHQGLPSRTADMAETVLQDAVERFASYHDNPAVAHEDWRILVDPKLALYYGNRLAGLQAPKGSR
jgi:glycerol-3-phosphate O-acyltransferase